MEFICPMCRKIEKKDIKMEEEHDKVTCPKCKTLLYLPSKSPLGRYVNEWKTHAENIDIFLRPPLYQSDLEPRIFSLYEDCYHTLLIGRYNASIVMMGVLLEAVMKERISLKLGRDFNKSYWACLNLIREKKWMKIDDIYFLENFRKNVRNLYQHSEEAKIVSGGFIRAWPIELEKGKEAESLKEGIEKIREAKIKSILVPTDAPVVRSIVKQERDHDNAIILFNQVYDFLLTSKIRYFKQKEYDESHKKFGTGMRL
ncbi:MAG: hypothetical protein HYT72_01730 [Candidatus Aenigmarchaeota archaeon]|nr:hypothetical protein [Candidatus Aenigmarchaeota archaeon]